MRIIISPAKKMNVDTDNAAWKDKPLFLDKTKVLMKVLQEMDFQQCQTLWKCSEKLTELNMERLRSMDLEKNLTPALLSYEGIQYQHISPLTFENGAWDYAQENLRILSGFYGVLKPLDGIVPYRLEMQAALSVGEFTNLYQYWGDFIAEAVFGEDDTVLNLASKEYSKCLNDYLKKQDRQTKPGKQNMITCVFGQKINGKVVEKGTLAKMARGEMVRYLAQNKVRDLAGVKEFSELGYVCQEELSNDRMYVFLTDKQN